MQIDEVQRGTYAEETHYHVTFLLARDLKDSNVDSCNLTLHQISSFVLSACKSTSFIYRLDLCQLLMPPRDPGASFTGGSAVNSKARV